MEDPVRLSEILEEVSNGEPLNPDEVIKGISAALSAQSEPNTPEFNRERKVGESKVLEEAEEKRQKILDEGRRLFPDQDWD